MRIHPSLRWALLLPSLALVPLGLRAQCCCTNIVLQIPLDHLSWVQSDRAFEVKETRGQYTFHRADKDSTDGRLDLLLDAGCGLRDIQLEITRRTNGERMVLTVLFVGFDGWHPGLRVPFRPGSFEVDLERMVGCAGLDRWQDRTAADARVPSTEEVSCGGCRLRVERDSTGVLLEPLDLWTDGCGAGSVEGDAYGKAGYTDGQLTFLEALAIQHAQGRPRSFPDGRGWSGIGHVGPTGSFHARMDREQTERVYDLEMSLMHITGWKPAWVLDEAAPGGRRSIGSMVRFTLERP
ncbi:MAG TPA: hypothetical protein PKE21_08080 [Flavobacteriales bacterium]|nr:hypothetical protein [Flavobacteriales bacterium]HMR27419.1 hypothetical protein [Flavobacteriales bacterium]